MRVRIFSRISKLRRTVRAPFLFVAAATVCIQVPACRPDGERDPSSFYRQTTPSDSAGTGRLYMGREIARVRSHDEVADWLDRPDRSVAEFPDRLVRALQLKPADVVADIGAGTGFYTFRLAKEVPHGRVMAVDIQDEMLAALRRRAQEEGLRNVEVVRGTEKDPNLPPESVDVALIVGSYPEFYYPYEMIKGIERSLVPGGRLVLAEYRAEDDTLPVSPVHRISEEQARKEMEFVGLRWIRTNSVLPQQHLMIFEKPIAGI